MNGRFFLKRVEGPLFRNYGFVARRGDRILFHCTVDDADAAQFLDPASPATHIAFDAGATVSVLMLQIGTTKDARGGRLIIGEHALQPDANPASRARHSR